MDKKQGPYGANLEIMELAKRLSPAQREELKILFEKNPPKDDTEGELLNLAIYNPNAWSRYVKRMGTIGSDDLSFNWILKPLIKEMPSGLKTQMVAHLHANYRSDLRKAVHTNDAKGYRKLDNFVGPRRAYDELIQAFVNAPEYMTKSTAGNNTNAEANLNAFDGYIHEVHKLLPTSTEKRLSSDEILKVAQKFQEYLRSKESDALFNNVQDLDQRQELKDNVSLIMHGSFTSGTFQKDSDIDLLFSNARHERSRNEMAEFISPAFESLGRPTPKLSNLMFSNYNAPKLAAVNPVMIKVDKNKITLLVYPNHYEQHEYKGLEQFSRYKASQDPVEYPLYIHP